MTTTINPDLSVEATSTLTKHQVKSKGPVFYAENGRNYRIIAKLRYDDSCGNGHNSFGITADIYEQRNGIWKDYSGGCCHEEIAKHFPDLAPFIKWHLTSSDGPMYYIANTVYHAGDRDHNGLLKGETRQIKNGKTGLPCWILETTVELPKYVDSAERPNESATALYVPWNTTGEGKDRDLKAARSCAVWPDATDEELTSPDLKSKLLARLPDLMAEFRAAMESLGFTY